MTSGPCAAAVFGLDDGQRHQQDDEAQPHDRQFVFGKATRGVTIETAFVAQRAGRDVITIPTDLFNGRTG